MNNVDIIIKEKQKCISYLLPWRFKSTSANYKVKGKTQTQKITHIFNKAIPNKQQNINVTAIGK